MEERTTSGRDPRGPSLFRILLLCAGAFAVETVYLMEEGYAIPAMLSTELPETVASAMWAVGPLLGLLFQGYLGSASDRCTSSWGKRRPFIAGLSACACLACLLFPYGGFVSETVLGLGEKSGRMFVMVFTASTFVAMDFFLDALQSPLRAYLLDSVPTERSEQANSTFTFLLCAGSVAGSFIAGVPWADLTSSGEGGEGDRESGSSKRYQQMEIAYGIATVVFIVCMLLCLNSIREKSPRSPSIKKKMPLPRAVKYKTLVEYNFSSSPTLKKPPAQTISMDYLNHELKLKTPTKHANGVCYVPIPRVPSPLSPIISIPAKTSALEEPCRGGCLSRFFGDVYNNLCGTILFTKYISRHFLLLCLTVLFSWVALLSVQLYFTSFIGQVVYGGSPHSSGGEKERKLFEDGVRAGFLVMLSNDIVSVSSSLLTKYLSDRVGIRRLLVSGLALYTVVCFITATYPTLLNAILLQAGAGLVYSHLQSLPYTLLKHYEVWYMCTHVVHTYNVHTSKCDIGINTYTLCVCVYGDSYISWAER